MRQAQRVGAALLCTALLAGLNACASSRITSSWRDQTDSAGPVRQLAVMVVFKDEAIAQFAENEAVRNLPAGTRGSAAHTLGIDRTADPAAARIRLAQAGFDAVLVSRLVTIDEQDTYHPPQLYFAQPSFGISPYYRSFWGYYPYAYASVVEPGYVTRTTRVLVESIVYRLPDDRPVWSAVTETVNPDSTQGLISELVDLVRNALQEQALIAR